MNVGNALLERSRRSMPWSAYRRAQLHAAYERRRDAYAAQAASLGLRYDSAAVPTRVRERLAARGCRPVARNMGDVHTFAFIPQVGWHASLLPDLRVLGPLTLFDYTTAGFSHSRFRARAPDVVARGAMNRMAIAALRAAHQLRPIDWVFIYANGSEILKDVIVEMGLITGAPVVSMCLDDKHSWEGVHAGTQRSGQVDIVAAFDLCWTSSTVATEWYLVEGACPLYQPEGFNADEHRRLELPADIDVSFVGAAYGFRPSIIRYLQRSGIPVRTFGSGWPGGAVSSNVEVFNRSRINLGMGGIGYSESLTNLKGRDFEIPACGGGVYLTSFNSDLSRHFRIGEEILCYRDRFDLLEQLRYYLAHPAEAAGIAARGRDRCLREHRWLHRYQTVCRLLGVLGE